MSKQYLDDPPPGQHIFEAVASGNAAAVESLLTDDPSLIDARGGDIVAFRSTKGRSFAERKTTPGVRLPSAKKAGRLP